MLRLAACLVLAGLCHGGEDERIDALVERFCNGGVVERRAARDALIRYGRKAWPHFRALLDHDDPDVRLRARLVWIDILTQAGESWGIPKPGTPCDPATGMPTLVLERKSGTLLVLLKPGTVEVNGRVYELKKPLYFGVCEVTKEAYGRGRPDLIYFYPSSQARMPIARVDLEEMASFCQGTGLRLPTEEEWLYAYYAGGAQAKPKARNKALLVGGKPNGLGLYNLRGNLAEWCTGPGGKPAVICGGSFLDDRLRVVATPDTAAPRADVGFRVVRYGAGLITAGCIVLATGGDCEPGSVTR